MILFLRNALFLLILIEASLSHAFLVDYLKFQHAGEIGFYAIGAGLDISERYSLEFFYGHVPKEFGGIVINTFSMKNNINIFSFNLLSILTEMFIGLNIYHVAGMNYQVSRKSSFPRNYYGEGSLRGMLYIGMNFKLSNSMRHGIYFESGINDLVLTNYYNNPDIIDPFDYASLGVGYSYDFF